MASKNSGAKVAKVANRPGAGKGQQEEMVLVIDGRRGKGRMMKMSKRLAMLGGVVIGGLMLSSCMTVQQAQWFTNQADDHVNHSNDPVFSVNVYVSDDGSCAWTPKGGEHWTPENVGSWPPKVAPTINTIIAPSKLGLVQVGYLYKDNSCSVWGIGAGIHTDFPGPGD